MTLWENENGTLAYMTLSHHASLYGGLAGIGLSHMWENGALGE